MDDLLSIYSLDLRAAFCTSTFITKFLIASFKVRTSEKQYLSMMYIIYANASKITLSTLTLVCSWYLESTLDTYNPPNHNKVIQASHVIPTNRVGT